MRYAKTVLIVVVMLFADAAGDRHGISGENERTHPTHELTLIMNSY